MEPARQIAEIFQRVFSPPVFDENAEKTRSAKRLHRVAWAAIILTVVYSTIWLIILPDLTHRLVYSVYMLLIAVSILVLVYRGLVDLASHVFLGAAWIFITIVAGTAGGTLSPFFGMYVLVLLSAVLFTGWRTAFLYGVLTFIAGLVMVWMMETGVIGAPFATASSAWLTQMTLVFLASLNGYIIYSDLQSTVQRAQTALRESEKTQSALRESEKRFRLTSSVTSDYTFSSQVDENGELTHTLLSGAFEAITGYTPAEYQTAGGWRAHLHPDDRDQDVRDFEALRNNQTVKSEIRFIKKGGEVRWASVSARPIWDNETNRLVGINGGVQDITERKQLEEALKDYNTQLEQLVNERTDEMKQAVDRLELVLNHTTNALAFADHQGNVLITNPAFRQTFGHMEQEAIESILWSLVEEEQITLASQGVINAIYNNISQRLEAQIIDVDGHHRDVDLAFIPVPMNNGQSTNGVLVSCHDITQMKDIERFKSQFVADAVHDLATPISGMSTRLYMLKRNPDRVSNHVRALENQVQHLRNLLEDLRTLAHLDRNQLQLEVSPYQLNDIVQRVYDTYEPVTVDKQQRLTLAMDETLPEVSIDARQIERVLVNLVSNAINYTPTGKTIHIETARENGQVICKVIDEGMGIASEHLQNIFKRFYRTDEAREQFANGTGLGLAITKELVEKHGGSVAVTSQIGDGSTFTVRLPVRE